MRHNRSATADPIWVKPHVALIIAFGAAALAALLPAPSTYRDLWGTPKFAGVSVLLWCALAVSSFVLGVMAGRSRPGATTRSNDRATNRSVDDFAQSDRGARVATVSLVAAIAGVTLWIALGFQRGLTFADVQASTDGVRGASGRNRELLASPIWLSPLIHSSIFAASVTGVVLARGERDRRDPKSVRLVVGYSLLVVLTTARAFFGSERLALLEVLVPFSLAMTFSTLWGPRWSQLSRRRRNTIRFLPAIFAIATVSIFATFELSRSWTAYSSQSDQSYADFIEDRMLGYYATAMNNSALLEREATPILPGARTQEWISIGLLNDLPDIFRAPTSEALPSYLDRLQEEANPEFNNPGGFYAPFHDLGAIGGVAFWVGMGYIAGNVFRRARRMELVGLLLYPQVLLGISEVPRIIIFSEGRWIFPASYAIVLAWVESRRTRPADVDPGAESAAGSIGSVAASTELTATPQ